MPPSILRVGPVLTSAGLTAPPEVDAMDFAFSTRVETLRRQLQDFMDTHVVPRHAQWLAEVQA
jgi:hypothetical protein